LLTPEGKIWVSGRRGNPNTTVYWDFWIRSLDLDGNTEWDRLLTGNFTPLIYEIKPFTQNRYLLVGALYCTGDVHFPIAPGFMGWLAILDSAANIKANFIAGTGKEKINDFSLLPDKKTIMAIGLTRSSSNPFCPYPPFNNNGDVDAWLTKIRIIDTATTANQNFIHQQPGLLLFPSPTHSSFSLLSLSLPSSACLFDAQGRRVKDFESVDCSENNYPVADLPRGIYTCCLMYGDGPVFRRILLE